MTVSTLIDEEAQKLAVQVSSNTHIDNYVLAASTPENIAKPTNAKYVLLSADGAFWAAYDKTASTGSTDITDGTGSELLPGLIPVWRQISLVTNISVAATAARKISALWKA